VLVIKTRCTFMDDSNTQVRESSKRWRIISCWSVKRKGQLFSIVVNCFVSWNLSFDWPFSNLNATISSSFTSSTTRMGFVYSWINLYEITILCVWGKYENVSSFISTRMSSWILKNYEYVNSRDVKSWIDYAPSKGSKTTCSSSLFSCNYGYLSSWMISLPKVFIHLIS